MEASEVCLKRMERSADIMHGDQEVVKGECGVIIKVGSEYLKGIEAVYERSKN